MSTKHSSSSGDGDRGRRGDSPSSSNQSQKSRIPKSCDSCRKSHVRCVMIAKMTPPNCRRCSGMGTTCVFSVITPARGATRREIESMETRLQEAEAVLGMIQAFPDHRVQSLLGDMAQDPRTRKVFDHVHQSQFGPGVKFKPLDSAPGPSRLSEPLPVSSTTRPVDKAGPSATGTTGTSSQAYSQDDLVSRLSPLSLAAPAEDDQEEENSNYDPSPDADDEE